MRKKVHKGFSGPVIVFHDRRLPEQGIPVGYAAIIDAYELRVPLPLCLCAIGERHRMVEKEGWRFFTPRYRPEPSLEGHLTFAVKYEGIDLAVLYCLLVRYRRMKSFLSYEMLPLAYTPAAYGFSMSGLPAGSSLSKT